MCNCDCCPKREVVSKAKLSAALDTVFHQYPNVRINYGAAVSLMLREVNPRIEDYKRATEQASDLLHDEVKLGTLIRSPGGSYMRVSPIVSAKQIHTSVNQAGEATVVNNHVCPSCGNNRVNKDERSCWKCGGSL